jgi:hypothetical protein
MVLDQGLWKERYAPACDVKSWQNYTVDVYVNKSGLFGKKKK